MKKFIGIILSFLTLVSFTSIFATTTSAEEGQAGSISVCKTVVDENNNVVVGSEKTGATFSISGFTPSPETSQGPAAGVLPNTTFVTPLTYNTDIFPNVPGNDAQCVTYGNLSLGSYYWTEESAPADGWDTPYYSDQYTGPVTNVVSLHSYDNRLFDGNLSNDGDRNFDADGNIILNSDRPTRMLIIVNRYKSTNTNPPFEPTATPSATVTPTTTVTPTPTTGITPGVGGPGGGDGLSDGRSDGKSSTPAAVLGTSTLNDPYKGVLGANTMAKTGSFEQNLMNLLGVVGMSLLGAAYLSHKKKLA